MVLGTRLRLPFALFFVSWLRSDFAVTGLLVQRGLRDTHGRNNTPIYTEITKADTDTWSTYPSMCILQMEYSVHGSDLSKGGQIAAPEIPPEQCKRGSYATAVTYNQT